MLDLSNQQTPPDLLAHFGVGDDWQGIYLPEVRVFVSTQKSAGVAFNAGVREMLIGIAPTLGIWGDLNFDVDFQGDALKVGLRLYDMVGKRYEPTLVPVTSEATAAHADRYQITVPGSPGPEAENFVLFIDVNSGAAPFVITAVAGEDLPDPDLNVFPDDAFFDNAANHPEDISVLQRIRLFSQEQRVAVRIKSRNPAQRRVIVLDVFRSLTFQPAPEQEKAKVPEATLDPESPHIFIEDNTEKDVVLRLQPPDGKLSIGNQERLLTDGAVRIPVPEDSSQAVTATWTTSVTQTLERVFVVLRAQTAAGRRRRDRDRRWCSRNR